MELFLYVGLAILFILIIVAFVLILHLKAKVDALNEYAEDGDLTGTIKAYYKRVNDLKILIHKVSDKSLEARLSACEQALNGAISKVYAVNFDAFDGVTGKQSFAAALLDASNSGIIITSIYGHASSNTYIRIVAEGTTSIKLTDEERTALEKAMAGEKRVPEVE